nr:hypothetical protein StreXyl84_11860 [Streptomyces sp. Xyl84]
MARARHAVGDNEHTGQARRLWGGASSGGRDGIALVNAGGSGRWQAVAGQPRQRLISPQPEICSVGTVRFWAGVRCRGGRRCDRTPGPEDLGRWSMVPLVMTGLWRRNPVRRRSDMAEGRIGLVTALALAVLAPLTGWLTAWRTEAVPALRAKDRSQAGTC